MKKILYIVNNLIKKEEKSSFLTQKPKLKKVVADNNHYTFNEISNNILNNLNK